MPTILGEDHLQMLDQLDISTIERPFRNKAWRPTQRRNKNVAQIISETARREMSLQATQNNSGSSTPLVPISEGAQTPAEMPGNDQNGVDLKQAAQNLSKLSAEGQDPRPSGSGPVSSYLSIESAPSLHPAQQQHYCDLTGLPGPYTDPKTRLRYHNKELFTEVRSLPAGMVDLYLAARGAQAILK